MKHGQRAEIVLGTFATTLWHTALQWDLLAAWPGSLNEAVWSGNEYLQIQYYSKPIRPGVTKVCENKEEMRTRGRNRQSWRLRQAQQLPQHMDQKELLIKALEENNEAVA